jgi:VanZ like protein
VARTAPGTWVLGPGLAAAGAVAVAALGRRLARRRAPLWAWLAVGAVAVVAGITLARLRAARLERTHLPEYGVAAALAWRAVVPLLPAGVSSYLVAALLAAAIGWGDELLQAVTPGRHYDVRDVALNALGAVLGVIVLAAARTGDATGRPGR